MIELLVGVLVALNVFQLLYWAHIVQRLVDRLMSKSFAEYQQVKNGPPPKSEPKEDLDAIHEENEILDEINRMLPTA